MIGGAKLIIYRRDLTLLTDQGVFTKCQGIMPYSYKYIGRDHRKVFFLLQGSITLLLIGLPIQDRPQLTVYFTSSHQAKIHSGPE